VSFLLPVIPFKWYIIICKFIPNRYSLEKEVPSLEEIARKSPYLNFNIFPYGYYKCDKFLSSCVTPQSTNLSPFWNSRALNPFIYQTL